MDHSQGLPGTGTFLLHQGIQRRISITVMHENGPDLIWRDVRELIVGRIRTTPIWDEPDSEHSVLSLNLMPAHYLRPPGEDRCVGIRTCIILMFPIQNRKLTDS